MKKILILTMLLATALFAGNCVAYTRPAPPPVRVEVKPARPHKTAVWVAGHWKWSRWKKRYVWVPGHWNVKKGRGRYGDNR